MRSKLEQNVIFGFESSAHMITREDCQKAAWTLMCPFTLGKLKCIVSAEEMSQKQNVILAE